MNTIVIPLLSRQDILREQKTDIYCQEQLNKSPNDKFVTDNDGLLYFNENGNTRLVVPKTLIPVSYTHLDVYKRQR